MATSSTAPTVAAARLPQKPQAGIWSLVKSQPPMTAPIIDDAAETLSASDLPRDPARQQPDDDPTEPTASGDTEVVGVFLQERHQREGSHSHRLLSLSLSYPWQKMYPRHL